MKKVCLQIGHVGIEGLQQEYLRSWRSATILQKSTGASGERDWHWNQLMPKLRDKLIQAGVQVYIVDAIYRQEIYTQNYDLWISLHHDGGGTNDRCMISAPNRNTKPDYLNSGAQQEAERFCAIWKELYPQITGNPNNDNFITAGMVDYYGFDFVSMDTPAVIVEHFNNTSPKGQELKNNPDLVAEADCKVILKFLGLDQPMQDETYKIVYKGQTLATYESNPIDKINSLNTEVENKNKEILEKQGTITTLQQALIQQEQDNGSLLADLNSVKKARDDWQVKYAQMETDKKTLELQKGNLEIAVTDLNKKLTAKDPLTAYTGWQLIRAGIKKLGKK